MASFEKLKSDLIQTWFIDIIWEPLYVHVVKGESRVHNFHGATLIVVLYVACMFSHKKQPEIYHLVRMFHSYATCLIVSYPPADDWIQLNSFSYMNEY